MTDLKGSFPQKLSEMKLALQDWQVRVNGQKPMPNPNFEASKRYEWVKNPYRK